MKFATSSEESASLPFKIVAPFDDTTGKFTDLTGHRNAIFLAGPCPRKDYSTDWRFDAYKILAELGFDGTVFTPTNAHYNEMISKFGEDRGSALAKQTAWEREAMHRCSALVFWIPRSEQFPARTTNIEFGEWYKKPGVYIGWPEGAIHNEYIGIKMAEQRKDRYAELKTLLEKVVSDLKRPGTVCFTSDTHFSQERTLNLSRRPFHDVLEMDLTMISNWNKTVRMTDKVVHAGDFMDVDKIDQLRMLLDSLNFSELYWTLGNYDRKVKDQILNVVNTYDRKIHLYDAAENKICGFADEGKKYGVVHEPNDFTYAAGKDVYLFGHIHGRAFAKSNGFDLATDYHGYTPISIGQVRWFVNAMNYWDKNVYSEAVSVAH